MLHDVYVCKYLTVTSCMHHVISEATPSVSVHAFRSHLIPWWHDVRSAQTTAMDQATFVHPYGLKTRSHYFVPPYGLQTRPHLSFLVVFKPGHICSSLWLSNQTTFVHPYGLQTRPPWWWWWWWWWWWSTDTSLRYRHWRMCFERHLQVFARRQPGNLFDIAAQPILEYRWIDSYTQLSLRTQFKVATVYSIHTQSLNIRSSLWPSIKATFVHSYGLQTEATFVPPCDLQTRPYLFLHVNTSKLSSQLSDSTQSRCIKNPQTASELLVGKPDGRWRMTLFFSLSYE